MALDKPSNPEDEYFAKEEQEKLKKLRVQLDAERKKQRDEQLRSAHWMKCPKCGHDMKEVMLRDIAVDMCKNCGGIFFDKGELELLTGMGGNFLKRVFSTFREDLNYGELIADKPGQPESK